MSTAENAIIKEVYAAINRNEFSEALKYFDSQVVRVEPAGYDTAGTHHGQAELLKHMNKGRSTWAEGTCEPVRFLAKDDKVIAFLHVKVRLKEKTEWIDGRMADVFTFKNGLITEMRTFWENHEALEWVGVKE
ncbi:MAG: nuclear transport factor 2 family protein [Pseudobdellovibrio sp.]